ncbi:hypothetical protein AW40_03275 [Kosakonia radicincitans UMEnt01/12]|uniref:hypothetical protein n=1 Tax=Kosakonia radicincitans TaxID=283686 RepID=UPI0004616219|nr:hypothetical protein [Kosakonia radicincitans]KDE37603.1 hypothetical protein AW40_03275 [Kosakonia radicincitans UMEnt01/12]
MRAAIIKVLAGLFYVAIAFFITGAVRPVDRFWLWSSDRLFDLLWQHKILADTYEWGMDPASTFMLVLIVLVIAWGLARGVKGVRIILGR